MKYFNFSGSIKVSKFMIDNINEGYLNLHFNSINQLTYFKMYIISKLKIWKLLH